MKFTSRENCSLYSPHDTIHLSISKSCNLYSGSTIIVVLIQWLVRLQTKLGSYQKRDLSINTASAINSNITQLQHCLLIWRLIYIYCLYNIWNIIEIYNYHRFIFKFIIAKNSSGKYYAHRLSSSGKLTVIAVT